jgi:hypothetical protein
VYLELRDASFSFDGVIGAFAITSDLPLIILGLGVGAYCVRSMTIYLVRHHSLAQYRYLAHGAYYSIFALALLMFASLRYSIPDFVTGLLGAGLILASLGSSIWENRRGLKTSPAS